MLGRKDSVTIATRTVQPSRTQGVHQPSTASVAGIEPMKSWREISEENPSAGMGVGGRRASVGERSADCEQAAERLDDNLRCVRVHPVAGTLDCDLADRGEEFAHSLGVVVGDITRP